MAAHTQPHQTKKKKHVHQQRKPPFPVPISGLTGEPCRANHWYYYTGKIYGDFVIVDHTGDISYLNDMGFFGHGLLSRGAPELYESLPFVMLPGKTESMPHKTRVMRKRMYLRHMRWKKCQDKTSRDYDTENDKLSELDEEFDSDLDYNPLQHNENTNEHEKDGREILASDDEAGACKTDRRFKTDSADYLPKMDENMQPKTTSENSSTDPWSSNLKDKSRENDWSHNQNEDIDFWTSTNQSKDTDLWNSKSTNQNTAVKSWDTMEADEDFWTSDAPAIVTEDKDKVLNHQDVSERLDDDGVDKDELVDRTDTENHLKAFDAIDTHKHKRDYEFVDNAGDNSNTNVSQKKIKLEHGRTNIPDNSELDSVSKTVSRESNDECNDVIEKDKSSGNHQNETDETNNKTDDCSDSMNNRGVLEYVESGDFDKADDNSTDDPKAESEMDEVTNVPKTETDVTEVKSDLPLLHPYCIEEADAEIDKLKAHGKGNSRDNVYAKSDDEPHWDKVRDKRIIGDSELNKSDYKGGSELNKSDHKVGDIGIDKEEGNKDRSNVLDKGDGNVHNNKENSDKDKNSIHGKRCDIEPGNKDHRDKIQDENDYNSETSNIKSGPNDKFDTDEEFDDLGNDKEDSNVKSELNNKDDVDKVPYNGGSDNENCDVESELSIRICGDTDHVKAGGIENPDVESEPNIRIRRDTDHVKAGGIEDYDVGSEPNIKIRGDTDHVKAGGIEDSDVERADYLVIEDSDIDEGMVYVNKKEKYRWKTVKKRDPYRLNEPLILALEEAFFLSYGLGCLFIQDEDRAGSHSNLTIQEMWSRYIRCKTRFLPLYAAYHFFRSKGWVPKPGIVFGVDFILYKVGPPFYHATYSIIVKTVVDGSLEEIEEYKGACQTWETFTGVHRTTEHVAKTLMFCYVVLPIDWKEIDKSSPDCLRTIKVRTQYINRWVSSQERGGKAGDDVL